MVGFQNLKCILFNNFYVCGPTSMKLKPHLVSKEWKVEWQNDGQVPITLGVMSLDRFQILSLLKIVLTDFAGTMKARKLKVRVNMDNDWMYCVYRNRGQGSITLGVISLGRFSKKLKCILLNIFYVCGPTLMKLIPHLVSKVRKM